MNESKINDVLLRYSSMMDEVMLRIKSIESIINQTSSTGYRQTDGEYICLQVRKILELIAFANMVSNMNLYADTYRKIERHYKAHLILEYIKKINPRYYPLPVKQDAATRTRIPLENGFLTEDEFIHLYNDCSEYLHAANPLTPQRSIHQVFEEYPKWIIKIIALLELHSIRLVDDTEIWVILNTIPNGKASSYLAKRYKPHT